MLRTLVIPEERWGAFFEMLNRLGHERPVRVEVMGRTLGDQEMARLRPFLGLEQENKGSEGGTVTLTVGSDEGEYTHRIVEPTRVSAAQDEHGVLGWVAIEDAGEAKTLIHFEELAALEAEFREAP
jgi:hypothetical protein